MAVTYKAISKLGAQRVHGYGGTIGTTNSYSNNDGNVGWYYIEYPDPYGTHPTRIYEHSYDAGVLFDGEIPAAVEPVSADAPLISATISLNGAIAASVSVGVKTAAISDSPQTRYVQLRANGSIIGVIASGSVSGTFSMTRAQAVSALAYGIKVFPSSEFGVAQSVTSVKLDGAQIVYSPNNPASRGRVTDLTPGPYSVIVAGEGAVIGYTYRHDAGGYAQAYLSVIARNQDSGETVTICRKASVSVADGARGSFTIPADTLGIGRWTLSVCAAPAASATYYPDTDAFWDGGQDFTYVVRENPSSSSVTCDGKPVPTVSWVSSAQAAYQVRFGDYDSGARVGSETSFTVPRIFRDGAYPVRVRTASSAGDWTDWTETEYVAVENVEPSGEFDVSAAQEGTVPVLSWGGGVALEWEQGAISSGSGVNSEGPSGTPSATRIRTPEDKMIPVASDALTVTIPSGMQWYVMRYSSTSVDDFISAAGWKTTSGATDAQVGEYVRFVLAYNPAASIGPSDGSKLQAGGSVVAAAHYAIFRNGEMIAVTDQNATQYVDRLGAGGEYEVLAVTADRYYKSSGPIPFRLRLAADLISADGGYTWIPCRLTPDRKQQPEDLREDMTFVYYAGAQKPSAFRTNQRQRTKQFSYIFFRRDAARALRDLVGQEIIVRTTRGERIRGAVAEMSWADAKQPIVSFSVREVRGEEDGVEYPA